MKWRRLLGVVALVPLALNVAPPTRGAILMPMCGGDGQVRLVPLSGKGQAPGDGDNGCCIKGCHAGSNRKKSQRNDPEK